MSGIFKYWLCAVFSVCVVSVAAQNYQVHASECQEDVMDLSQRDTEVRDQNGEQCAMIRVESPIAGMLKFDLGSQVVEHTEFKDDEVWIWVGPNVKRMTISCQGCKPHKDYRPGELKGGHVYHFKVTTGLPRETATKQYLNVYCYQVPFSVSIDGQPEEVSDKNQFTRSVALGTHNIVVTAPHYKPFVKDVKLSRSFASRDTVNLAPNYGVLIVRSNVQGYQLFIDNQEYKGKGEIKLDEGRHAISVRKDNYTSHNEYVVVHVGDRPVVNATLTPNFIVVNISAKEADTEIYINGEYRGLGKCTYEFDYSERYDIEGRRKGSQTFIVDRHEFNANSPKTITIPELKRQFGTLNISFSPKDATLKIDGITRPTRNGEFSDSRIPIGQHVIQLRHDDYQSVEEVVLIENAEVTPKAYELIKVRTGLVTIKTDDNVSILHMQDGEETYKGSSEWTGKLPVGENHIILRNTEGLECEYTIFVDEDKKMQKQLKFLRTLKVNAPKGSTVHVNSGREVITAKPNKKLTLPPKLYQVVVRKVSYDPYTREVDLTDPNNQKVVVNAEMYRESGSYDAPSSTSTASSATPSGNSSETRTTRSTDFLDRYYSYSGDYYIGVVGMGYTFNITDKSHWLSFSFLPMRFKMFEMRLFDAETAVKDFGKVWIYKPTLQLVIPLAQSWSLNVYGGVGMDMNSTINKVAKKDVVAATDFYAAAVAGLSIRASMAPMMPMDIFAEYRYPFVGPTTYQEQGFRVGVSLSLGATKWK